MALQIVSWDDNGPVYADVPAPIMPTAATAPAPVLNTAQLAAISQPEVLQQLSSQLSGTQIGFTPQQVESDIPLLGSGSAGYTSTGQGVTPEIEYVTNWQGDIEAVPTGNYVVQLTSAFDPTVDGGQYGYYTATVDSTGNVQDVNFQKADKHQGWFGENLDWLGPALVLGAAGLGSGLFAGSGAGAGTLGAEAAIDFGALTGANSGTIAGINATGFGASELAATAYSNAIANGAAPEVANMAADVAAALEGSGMTAADILGTANAVAADTMSLGAVDAAGNVIGGGGALTIDAGAGLGGGLPGLDTEGLNTLINDITNSNLIEAETSIPDTTTTPTTTTTTPTTTTAPPTTTTTPPTTTTIPGTTIPTNTFTDFLRNLVSLPGLSNVNLSNVLGGALQTAGAKSIYDRLSGLGPQIRDAYTALGQNVQGQYKDISTGVQGNLGGLFGAAQQAGLKAYGAADQIDLANLRQQEFDIMQAMMADPRAAQMASAEARQIAQGRGGLQSFNPAYSAQFTNPITGQTYTVGADPTQVAMYKAFANQDLQNYLTADKNALARYTSLLGAGNTQATQAQNLQNQWMTPLTTGIGAYQNLASTGLQGWGTAEKAAADAYAKMVQGITGGVSQGLTGTGQNNVLSGLFDAFTNSNTGGLTDTGNIISEMWT